MYIYNHHWLIHMLILIHVCVSVSNCRGVITLLKLLRSMKHIKSKTVPELFTDSVIRHPNKTAILFENTKYTFRELDRYSNQIANFFESIGVCRGDTVALFMTNSPQYIATMIGLSKLGARSSLINFNLRDKSLRHSISICSPSAIIYDVGLSDALGCVLEELGEDLQRMSFSVGGDPLLDQSRSFDAAVSTMPDNPPPPLTGTSADGKGRKLLLAMFCFVYCLFFISALIPFY